MDNCRINLPNTYLGERVNAFFDQLQAYLNTVTLKHPIEIYIAGGVSVHIYSNQVRMSSDIDADVGRLWLDSDISVPIIAQNGKEMALSFDRGFNTSFTLIHPSYKDDAWKLNLHSNFSDISIFLMSPVDVATSKVIRFDGPDAFDIISLASKGYFSSQEFEKRIAEAFEYYPIISPMHQLNAKEAVNLVKSLEVGEKQLVWIGDLDFIDKLKAKYDGFVFDVDPKIIAQSTLAYITDTPFLLAPESIGFSKKDILEFLNQKLDDQHQQSKTGFIHAGKHIKLITDINNLESEIRKGSNQELTF